MIDRTPPKKLFRYRSAASEHFKRELVEAIDHHKVWVWRIDQQNDPFEALPEFLESSESELKGLSKELKTWHGPDMLFSGSNWRGLLQSRNVTPTQEHLNYFRVISEDVLAQADITKKAFVDSRAGIKIAAFCENADSLLLWSHYADAHRGVRIDYEWEPNANASYQSPMLVPVTYSKSRPQVSLLDACRYVAASRLGNEGISSNTFQNEVLEKILLTKSDDWSYEAEWRIAEADDLGPRYTIVLPLKVISITCGAEASDATVAYCTKIAREANRDIPVFKCAVSQSGFLLKRHRVN